MINPYKRHLDSCSTSETVIKHTPPTHTVHRRIPAIMRSLVSQASVLPLELFLLIAQHSDDASIFTLRAASYALNELITPVAFRTLLVKLRRGCCRARLADVVNASKYQAKLESRKNQMEHLAPYFQACRIEMDEAVGKGTSFLLTASCGMA
jgi:hypothetical protein